MADRPPIQAARFKSHRATRIGKRLRANQTNAERLLWRELRHFDIGDTHFRRQAPIGSYIVDIVCHGAKLIVEIDGGAHRAPDVIARDLERQTWLESRGYRVIRIQNAEVEADASAVAARIIAHVDLSTPTPNPAPQGGGERA